MSKRISDTFARLKHSGKKVLSPYITAGDPYPEITVKMLHALVDAGADIIELGVPFSDPMAEGPVIQAAMERALRHGVGISDVLAMVEDFRQSNQHTPIILMGYVNPIEMMGYEAFAKQASKAGVDGTIIVDLPPEEGEALTAAWQAHDLDAIYLCSPTTSDERMDKINTLASGYLYYVSLKGVTGSASLNVDEVSSAYQKRKSQISLPLLVGFGIKTAENAAAIASFADGVVVGAGLVSRMAEEQADESRLLSYAPQLIAEMRAAIDSE